MLHNPTTILGSIASSLPSMVVSARLGGKLAGGLGASGVVGGAVGEGVAAAGSQADQIRQETKDGLLTDKQVGASIVDGVGTGLISLASGRLANKLGIGDADTLFAQSAMRNANTLEKPVGLANYAKGVGKGFLAEGVLEEAPQSVLDQVTQNYALDKELTEGVGSAAAQGLLTGGIMGAGVNATRGYTNQQPTNENTPQPDPNASTPYQHFGEVERIDPTVPQLEYQPTLPSAQLPYQPTGNTINVSPDGVAFADNQTNDYLQGQQAQDRYNRDQNLPQDIKDVTPVPQGYEAQRDIPALPAPQNDFTVTSDGVALTSQDINQSIQDQNQIDIDRRNARMRGEVNDVTPIPQATPAEQIGLNPNHGALSSAATIAVNTGASTADNTLADNNVQAPTRQNLADIANTTATAPQTILQAYGKDPKSTWDSLDQSQRVSLLSNLYSDPNTATEVAQQDFEKLKINTKSELKKVAQAQLATAQSPQNIQDGQANPTSNFILGDSGSPKVFAKAQGANNYLTKNGMADSHEVVPVGNKFAVAQKAQAQPLLQNQPQNQPQSMLSSKVYGNDSYIQHGNERHSTRVAIMEADELAPDSKDTDNQFRDRTRVASQAQIDSIANNLDPRQLTDSSTMATGSPTLANDGKTIIAGNGRTQAIKKAYAQGKAEEYRQSVIQQAQQHGIDPSVVAGMKNPVLVKEFANPVDTKQMAIASNENAGLAMSAKEQARADSERVTKPLPQILQDQNGYPKQIIGNRNAKRLLADNGLIDDVNIIKLENGKYTFEPKENQPFSEPTQDEVNTFIDKALNSNDKNELTLFPASQKEIDIAKNNGLDITGMYHALKAETLRHAINSHSQDDSRTDGKRSKQRSLTVADLRKIPDVLRNFDELIVQKRKENESSLVYKKQMPDGTVEYVERVIETSRENKPRLVTQTVWVGWHAIGVISSKLPQVYTPDTPSTTEVASTNNNTTGVSESQSDRRAGKSAIELVRPDQSEGNANGIGKSPREIQLTPKDEAVKILQGEPVAQINENELNMPMTGGYKAIVEWAGKIFNQWGNKVTSPILGEIVVNERSIKDSISHDKKLNPYKNLALASIKDVLEKGALIHADYNTKGEDSYFVTAPVIINGNKNIVTVLVHRDINTQRMYLHYVGLAEKLMQSHYNMTAAQDSKVSRKHNGSATASDIATIIQDLLTVNNETIIDENLTPSQQKMLEIIGNLAENDPKKTEYLKQTREVDNSDTEDGKAERSKLMKEISTYAMVQGKKLKIQEEFEQLGYTITANHAEVDNAKQEANTTLTAKKGDKSVEIKINKTIVNKRANDNTRDGFFINDGNDEYRLGLNEPDIAQRIDTRANNNEAPFNKDYFTDKRPRLEIGENPTDWQQRMAGQLARLYDNDPALAGFTARANDRTLGGTKKNSLRLDIKRYADEKARTGEALLESEVTDRINDIYHGGQIKYSLNENANSEFAQAVDDFVAGKDIRESISLGRTPDVLKMLGLPDTDVKIKDKRLSKILKDKHGLTPERLKQLPKQLNNPVAVFRSSEDSTNPDGYVVLTELTEFNRDKQVSEPVIVALHINKAGTVIDVASAYGKNHNGLQKILNNDKVLFWNKAKGSQLVNVHRLQLPLRLRSDVTLSMNNIKTESDLSQYVQQKQNSELATSQYQTNTMPDQVQTVLTEKFGKETIDSLLNNGVLQILTAEQAREIDPNLPDSADGFYHNGTATLIADRLNPDMIIPTFLHELGGHGGFQTLLPKSTYQSFMNEFDRLVAEGNPLAVQAKQLADTHSPNQAVANEEYLPYLLSLTSRQQAMQGKVASLINRLAMAVRSFLRSQFGVPFKVTANDITALAEKLVSERATMAEVNGKNQEGNFSPVKNIATNISQAREMVKTFQNKPILNQETGTIASVSRNNLDKMLSAKAMEKSVDYQAHLTAVANIDDLFEKAVHGWDKNDRNNDTNIEAISRFFAPMVMDGKAYLVKLTVKRFGVDSQGNRIYTVESLDVNEKNPVPNMVDADLKDELISDRSHRVLDSLIQQIVDFNNNPKFSQQTPQTEIDNVRKLYEGTDQWLKAPNGQATKLTEQQWLQVRTPSFKAWFGDWENDPENASKVVDENGEPMVVYHGTKAKFTKFTKDKIDELNGMEYGVGFYHSTNKDFSERYGKVSDFFVNIKSPFAVTKNVGFVTDVVNRIGFTKKNYSDAKKMRSQHFERKLAGEIVEKNGYDGIFADDLLTEIVSFSPNQIKSATDNIGTFDSKNDDIRYSQSAMKSIEANILRGRNAINKALVEKTSVHRAMYRNDIGWIDFVWGDVGKLKANGKKTIGAKGLSHIIEARVRKNNLTEQQAQSELINEMVETIAKGETVDKQETNNEVKIKVDYQGYRAVLLKEKGNNAWVVTAFELSKDESSKGHGKTTSTEYQSYSARTDTGALNNNSINPSDKNSNIRYSQLGGIHLSQNASILSSGIRGMMNNINYTGKLSAWHKTVGTMYNLAERNPLFKPVYDYAEKFVNDVSLYASRASQYAPKLLPKLESLKDIVRKPIKVTDNKAIAKPIFEGTLSWYRDPVTKKPVQTNDVNKAGIVWKDGELRTMFGLNDEQIELYQEFRKTADSSLQDMAKAEMLRLLGKDGHAISETVMQAEFADGLAQVKQHIRDLITQEPKSATRLNNILAKINDKVDKVNHLIDTGYTPITRFGKHTVSVVVNGKQEYLGMFDTAKEANLMAIKMRTQYGTNNVSQGIQSKEALQKYNGVTPETAELFGDILGINPNSTDPRDMAFQAYIQNARDNRSALRRLSKEQNIKGYSEDVTRVLASFVYSNARLTSSMLNTSHLNAAVEAIPQDQGEIKDAAAKLADYIQNPQEEGQAIRGFMFAQYLGGSIASGLVNISQPFMVSMPWLSQYGGATNATKQILKASSDLKFLLSGKNNFEPGLQQAIAKAEADGVISPQEVFNLMKQAQGKNPLPTGDGTFKGDAAAAVQGGWAKLMVGWGSMFSYTEQINRRLTYVASYRTAVEQGMADPDAFARRAIRETQFVYNKANKMQWGRGAVGGTLMTFKTYTISYIELMSRMWGNGTEGKKAVGFMLLMMFALGGAGGLPFAEDAQDIVDAIAQLFGYNINSGKQLNKIAEGMVGKVAADFMGRGVTPLLPLDLAGRLGMGNLIPGTGLLKDRADHSKDIAELAGPAGEFLTRVATGTKGVAQGTADIMQGKFAHGAGEIGGGLMQFAPKAVSNLAKGADMANTGHYRDAKGYNVIKTDALDAALKMIGFQSEKVADIQDKNFVNQSLVATQEKRASEIRAMWATGIHEKDSNKIEEARAMRDDWNSKNPDQRIIINMGAVVRKAREMEKSKQERIAKATPKSMRPEVRASYQ